MPEAEVVREYQRLIDEGKARPGKDARGKAEAIVAERERAEQASSAPAQQRPAPSSSTSPAAPASHIKIGGSGFYNFWVVIALAIVIAAISILVGHWSSGLFVALIVLLVMGAVFPPAAVLIGGVVVLDLLFVHHNELSKALNAALGVPPTSSSSSGGASANPHQRERT